MNRLKGLYLEEVEMILDNLNNKEKVEVEREKGKSQLFSIFFEDVELSRRMEDLIYFVEKDYGELGSERLESGFYVEEDDY